mgnify:CR=1 FL=1
MKKLFKIRNLIYKIESKSERILTTGITNLKEVKDFISVQKDAKVRDAFNIMKDKDISQIPVMDNGTMVGSLTESDILKHILANPLVNSENEVSEIMTPSFPLVEEDLPFTQLSKYFTKDNKAVVAKDKAGSMHVLTQYDVVQAV